MNGRPSWTSKEMTVESDDGNRFSDHGTDRKTEVGIIKVEGTLGHKSLDSAIDRSKKWKRDNADTAGLLEAVNTHI